MVSVQTSIYDAGKWEMKVPKFHAWEHRIICINNSALIVIQTIICYFLEWYENKVRSCDYSFQAYLSLCHKSIFKYSSILFIVSKFSSFSYEGTFLYHICTDAQKLMVPVPVCSHWMTNETSPIVSLLFWLNGHLLNLWEGNSLIVMAIRLKEFQKRNKFVIFNAIFL